MASMTITNARAVMGGKIQSCNIRLADGKIQGLLPPGDTYGKTYDAKNKLVAPGFIDVHTHGAAGVDFNHADAKDVRTVRDFFAAQGVTTFLPTVVADTEETMLRSIMAVGRAKTELLCPQIYGVHLEGPFLNPQNKGAIAEKMLRAPDYNLFRRLQAASGGLIRRVTLAPELSGSTELIGRLRGEGISVSLGHCSATYEQTMAAVEAGAHSATHLFNAMAPLEHHQPGVIGAAFASDIYCEAICDGKHLHPGTVCMIFAAKGTRRTVAVTDSMSAAGLGDGLYKLGVHDVVVKGLDAKLLGDGTRAGSVLTMPAALKNLMAFTQRPLEEVLPCLTETPARMMGIFNQKGSIDVGKDGDLVVLDRDCHVAATFSCGVLMYQA